MANAYVVDTGVFLRWFVDQDGFEHARRIQRQFTEGVTRLETVDFARIEVAEVLRKKGFLAGRLNQEEFQAAAQVIDDLGVVIHASDADRLARATSLAARHTLRIFDALFLQVALDRGLPLLTTDRRLGRAASGLVNITFWKGSNQWSLRVQEISAASDAAVRGSCRG